MDLKLRLPAYTATDTVQLFSEIYDWGLLDLGIPEAHKQSLGEDVKIAILDSGKSEHFEVQNNIVESVNFSGSNNVNDLQGHATVVSGIIAAEKNSEGIIGVAPKSKIYFAKIMDDGGNGEPSSLVKAIYWAISQHVDIISISAGMFFDFKPLYEAIKKAYANNIIIVSACGNSSNRYYDIAFPARYPEVIGVAAYDKFRKVAKFSSRGASIAFAMPGTDIYSTYLNNSFVRLNGTSFAAPIMSGICALILAKHRKNDNNSTPCETPKQMFEHLKKYAKQLGPKNETGFGTIDLDSLLKET